MNPDWYSVPWYLVVLISYPGQRCEGEWVKGGGAGEGVGCEERGRWEELERVSKIKVMHTWEGVGMGLISAEM